MKRVGRWYQVALVWSTAGIVAACGGTDDDSGAQPGTSGVPHPGSLLVLDARDQPMPALKVELAGALLTTDAHGSAAVPKLPPHYDFVTRVGQQVFAFEGLTSSGPTVKLRTGPVTATPWSFGLEIDATPGANQMVLAAIDVEGDGVDHPALSGSNSSTTVRWYGAAQATVTVDAFLVDTDPNTFAIVNYAGFAHGTWTATDGMGVTWQPAFAPPSFATTTIHLETSAPADITVSNVAIFRRTDWGSQASFAIGQSGASADFLVPTTPAYRYELFAQGSDGVNTSAAFALDVAPGDKVHITLPRAPGAVAPPDGFTGVTPDTEFSWNAVDDAFYELDARSAQSLFSYQIFTSALSTHLPDTHALGLEFPQQPDFTWSVRSVAHVALDAYAAGKPASSGSGMSGSRSFTTALPP